jgi:probable HAF family extracellular repeat protein
MTMSRHRWLRALPFSIQPVEAERCRHRAARPRPAHPVRPLERLEDRSCPSSFNYTQLPPLTGGGGNAYGLNNAHPAQVVGSSAGEAVLWQKPAGGTYSALDLGTLGGSGGGQAHAINDSGQVVGVADTGGVDASGNPIVHAFLWTPGGTDGVPSNPQMKDLDANSNTESFPLAVSNDGKVVGDFVEDPATNVYHAFLWENSQWYDLNTLLPPGTGWLLLDAVGINATQIAGLGELNGQPHAFQITDSDGVFSDGFSITDLGPSAGGIGRGVTGMSSDGSQVVGTNTAGHATLWHNGVATDLGTPTGGTYSEGADVNTSAQVVGYYVRGTFLPFYWQNGRMTDLNKLVSGNSTVWWAYAINNAGDIVGQGYGSQAIILIPATTKTAPSTLTATSTGSTATQTMSLGTTADDPDTPSSFPQGPLGVIPDTATWATALRPAAHRRQATGGPALPTTASSPDGLQDAGRGPWAP